MYERMTDKTVQPTVEEIQSYIGDIHWNLLQEFETELQARYELSRDLRYPFGNSYGWGFKYAHKTKHLCYLFFEKGAMTVTLQIGDKEVPELNKVLGSLSKNTQSLWENRYPCGDVGGWVHYRILDEKNLKDVITLIAIRKKPMKIDNCQ